MKQPLLMAPFIPLMVDRQRSNTLPYKKINCRDFLDSLRQTYGSVYFIVHTSIPFHILHLRNCLTINRMTGITLNKLIYCYLRVCLCPMITDQVFLSQNGEHLNTNLIVSTLRNNEVGIFFGWFDKRLMHWFYRVQILIMD